MKPNIDTNSLIFEIAHALVSKEMKAALETEMTVENATTVFENPVLDAIILAAINSEAVSSETIKSFSTVKHNLQASKLVL